MSPVPVRADGEADARPQEPLQLRTRVEPPCSGATLHTPPTTKGAALGALRTPHSPSFHSCLRASVRGPSAVEVRAFCSLGPKASSVPQRRGSHRPWHRSSGTHSHRVKATRSAVSTEGSSRPPGERSRDLRARGLSGLHRALGPCRRASAYKLRSRGMRATAVRPWGHWETPAT